MSGMSVVRLSWHEPLLSAVLARLQTLGRGQGEDFSHLRLIVPTAQAGRLLSERLTLAVAAQGRGLLPPEIMTPKGLLRPPEDGIPGAGEDALIFAWIETLAEVDWSRYGELFPTPPEAGPGWLLGLARRLRQLQEELGESGLDFASVAGRVTDTPFEPGRWRQLADLEKRFQAILREKSLRDPLVAERALLTSPPPPDPAIEKTILCAVPDPLPIAVRLLEQVSVEVWVYGPEEDGEKLFDRWGRPDPAVWSVRPQALESTGSHLHCLETPGGVAAAVARRVRARTPGQTVLGVADPALGPGLAEALRQAGRESYRPEGEALDQAGPGLLAGLLLDLAEQPSSTTIRSILHHPHARARLLRRSAENLSPENLLRLFDRLCERHRPSGLEGLLHFAGRPTGEGRKPFQDLQPALAELAHWADRLRDPEGIESGLAAILADIYAGLSVPRDSRPGRLLAERAAALRNLLLALRQARQSFPRLSATVARQQLRYRLRRERIDTERPREAFDLLGWLELLWDEKPELLLLGLNDGVVPETIHGDAFLPETLREHLGLKTNRARFARDAYLLASLLNWRGKAGGRTEILISSRAADQSPLRPSRLLFTGDDPTVLARVKTLFPEEFPPAPAILRPPPVQLVPPSGLPFPETIPVSALGSYLQCPFRFFLRQILKMHPSQALERELSAADFGSVIHRVVEVLRGKQLEPGTDWMALTDELLKRADTYLESQYGPRLTFALRLQREAIHARLQALVRVQQDWVTEHQPTIVEEAEISMRWAWEGCLLTGRIDRVDRLADGTYAILDYKTGNTATAPAKHHLVPATARRTLPHLPGEAGHDGVDDKGKSKSLLWADLQLPLYAAYWREKTGQIPRVGYINLPKSGEGAEVAFWEGFGETEIESALACAKALIGQIRAGVFWPPNPHLRETFDDYAPLFPDGFAQSVDHALLEAYPFTFGKEPADPQDQEVSS